MTNSLLHTTVLGTTTCASCGVLFAMPDTLLAKRRDDGGNFYCPNGHSLVFKDSEAVRLRRRLDHAEKLEAALREQRDAAERSNIALRGVVTRTKRRAAAGVCHCCKRTFQNVAAHMTTEHPDFVAGVQEGQTS